MSAPKICDFGFFGRITELRAAEIDKLTELDYRHEMAVIALDEDTGHMLGLVRLIDDLDERTAQFCAHRAIATGHSD